MEISQTRPMVVVGASSDPQKYGHRVFRDLLQSGYTVSPINPKGGELLGKMVYESITHYLQMNPTQRPLVITVTQPEITRAIVKEAHDTGLCDIWMQPGSESKDAVSDATAFGMDVVSDACIMKHEHIW